MTARWSTGAWTSRSFSTGVRSPSLLPTSDPCILHPESLCRTPDLPLLSQSLEVPTVLPDTTGTLVCALGLILGLGASLGGITLIITGMCPAPSGALGVSGEEGGDSAQGWGVRTRDLEGSRDKQRGRQGVRLEGGGQRRTQNCELEA